MFKAKQMLREGCLVWRFVSHRCVCLLMCWWVFSVAHIPSCLIGAEAMKLPNLFEIANNIPRSGTAGNARAGTVPDPPWEFQARRIYYQFLAIPSETAQKYCPPCRKIHDGENSGNNKKSPLIILSLGGFTLGGIVCIEYENSPIGPYREVAILSSLVGSWRSPLQLPAIGAWASHIFVDLEDAAVYGEKFWGLPASVVPIQFSSSGDENNAGEHTRDCDTIWFSDQAIRISGWRQQVNESMPAKSDDAPSLLSRFSLSLPSFSGLLSLGGRSIGKTNGDQANGVGSKTSPLLQYPLSIMGPKSIELESSKAIQFSSNNNNRPMQEVQDLLKQSRPLVSVGITDVKLQAGIPQIID